jgi:hypothetical protein
MIFEAMAFLLMAKIGGMTNRAKVNTSNLVP